LVRSINTSAVALLPVLSILVVGVSLLGVGTLNDLALALFVGMLVGTYSSIFVATPFLCQLKERAAENIALAKRVQARRKTGDVAVDAQPLVSAGSPIVASAGPRQQQVKKPRSRRSGK
jgi:preprotein translocase subunit SecF